MRMTWYLSKKTTVKPSQARATKVHLRCKWITQKKTFHGSEKWFHSGNTFTVEKRDKASFTVTESSTYLSVCLTFPVVCLISQHNNIQGGKVPIPTKEHFVIIVQFFSWNESRSISGLKNGSKKLASMGWDRIFPWKWQWSNCSTPWPKKNF